MQFPDSLTIVRATKTDAYGNPGTSFTDATRAPGNGFLVTPETLLLPPDAVVSAGDRVEVRGGVYAVTEAVPVRSPARTVLWKLTVEERR